MHYTVICQMYTEDIGVECMEYTLGIRGELSITGVLQYNNETTMTSQYGNDIL